MKLRRTGSAYDEGMLTPMFFDKEAGGNESIGQWLAGDESYGDTSSKILIGRDRYINLIRDEGTRSENSAIRSEKKALDMVRHVGSQIKQAGGRELRAAHIQHSGRSDGRS